MAYIVARENFEISTVKDLLNAIYYLDSKYKVLKNGKPMFADTTPIISLTFISTMHGDGIQNDFVLSDYKNDPLDPMNELDEE